MNFDCIVEAAKTAIKNDWPVIIVQNIGRENHITFIKKLIDDGDFAEAIEHLRVFVQ